MPYPVEVEVGGATVFVHAGGALRAALEPVRLRSRRVARSPGARATALEADAPDVVACWRVFDCQLPGLKALRRELRRARPRRRCAAHPRPAGGGRPTQLERDACATARGAAARAGRRGRLERGPGVRAHHRRATLPARVGRARRRRQLAGAPTRRSSRRRSPDGRTRRARSCWSCSRSRRRAMREPRPSASTATSDSAAAWSTRSSGTCAAASGSSSSGSTTCMHLEQINRLLDTAAGDGADA